jgi:protein SCO1/2
MIHVRNILKLLFVLAVALLLSACSRSESTALSGETIYPLRGVVREVRQEDSSVVIEHEDVPGYMPAMTMPFNVRDEALFEHLKPGEAIAFELVVTDDSSWIRDISATDISSLQLPSKTRSIAPAANFSRLVEGDLQPDFQLLDQQGRAITPQTFAGQDLILTFIFTRCPLPDFCPRMSSQFAELEKAVLDDPELRSHVRLLSISIDPEFDKPAVLQDYAAHFSRGEGDLWRFAVGTPEQTERLTHAFSVHTEVAGGTISHGLCTAWIGPDGIVKQLWRGNGWKPQDVLSAIKSNTPTH